MSVTESLNLGQRQRIESVPLFAAIEPLDFGEDLSSHAHSLEPSGGSEKDLEQLCDRAMCEKPVVKACAIGRVQLRQLLAIVDRQKPNAMAPGIDEPVIEILVPTGTAEAIRGRLAKARE